MLLTTIRIVLKEMKEGKSVEETKNANVLERWKDWGRFLEFLNTDYWIEAILVKPSIILQRCSHKLENGKKYYLSDVFSEK